MKIAIIGYGKMGKTIEQLAIEKGHEIVLKVDIKNAFTWTNEQLKKADIAIEFTRPESAIGNIIRCFECGVPVISGTTGWVEKMDKIKDTCKILDGGFFYASNFSIGVNLFFKLNKILAKMMETYSDYDVSLEEIHHTQKLDAPSGTAITLAEGLLEKISRKSKWINEAIRKESDLPIFSKRIENIPGTHSIHYDSEIDSIEIKHTAHSRLGFAKGALMAAEWMNNRKGVYSMDDLLSQTIT
ncbi:4-hydroxy-tetrahydrodipicolinate reductase [bacterium]|nr:4-hydroxy-tetrahydrodipicolinate reductase [Saprospiraceae bacterium]MDC3253700.1 4-hydroxy-tetrahydrodipicolinate reductase [bacterium]